MKDFHRGFICQSIEAGKKGHRSKHHSNKNEVCKCYAQYVKLHYHDCPVARKPCPVHGSPRHHRVKDEKAEKKENMVISFHPSSKTDKLFKPVKNFLAHCGPETQIDLEYYSPNNSSSKDGMKHRQVQTNPEEFKKSLGSNVFVEKTKYFVTDKTNRMKRLKQCFYSPCNSIVTRTRSQTTVKDKTNENFREEAKRIAIATNIPEEPSDDMYFYEKSKWTSSNKLDSSDWEKFSDDKIESDFVTVTKQVENKVTDHKIFEIRHKKGLADVRFAKLPRQSPLIYSSYDTVKSKSVSTDLGVRADFPSEQKGSKNYSKDKELLKTNIKKDEISNSEKSQSSSSGSVYFTSFILIPPGMEDSSSDGWKPADFVPKESTGNVDEDKTRGKAINAGNTYVQNKNTNDTSVESENSNLSKPSEFDKRVVPLKQEKSAGSENTLPSMKFMLTPEKSPSSSKMSQRKVSHSTVDNFQPKNKSTKMIKSPPNSRITDECDLLENEFCSKKFSDPLPLLEETCKRLSEKNFDSATVTTDPVQKREVPLVNHENKTNSDKVTQTDPVLIEDVQVKTAAAKENKSPISTADVSVQTSFTSSDSKVNMLVTSYVSPAPFPDDNKCQRAKSRSDGNLYDKQKENPENGNVVPLHHICLCDKSETSTSDSDLNACEKTDKSENNILEKDNLKPMYQNRDERRPSEVRKEVTSTGQTVPYDLSKLVRLANEFFDKVNKEGLRGCVCEKIKRDSNTDQETNASKPVKIPKTMVDAQTQTTFKMILDLSVEDELRENPIKFKILRSVWAQDDGETILECNLYYQEVNKVVTDISRSADGLKKPPGSKKKVTSISVGTPDSSNTVTVYAIKESLSETNKTITCDVNNKTAKECFINAINTKPSDNFHTFAPKKKPEDDSVRKADQPSEKNTIKKEPNFKCWNSPENSILSQTQTVPKPSNMPKPTLLPYRSKIPTADSTPQKAMNFKELRTAKMNTRNTFTQFTRKESFKTQRERIPTLNKNTVCICDHSGVTDGKPPSKIEPSTLNKTSKNSYQKPPLPTRQQPGMSKPRASGNVPTQTASKKPGQKKTVIYHAIISPIWYTELRKTWKITKNFHKSKSTILNQKRCCDRGDDSPGGKKVKGRDEGSGENFASNVGTTIDARNGTGVVWIPSSSPTGKVACFIKGTQSESKLSKSCSQNSTFFKGLNKRIPTNVLSIKSCRLKPVQVNEKHPFRKLFECRLCKSLGFLKNDQKDTLRNEQPSEGAFGYEPQKPENDSPISNEDIPERIHWTFSPPGEDEFLVKYSLSSDGNDSTYLSENSDSARDDFPQAKTERIELNFIRPPNIQQPDSFSDLTIPSMSFDKFWFGGDTGE